MKFETISAFFLLAMLSEFIEIREAYKSIRPYKYYAPRSRWHKPRWHPYRKPVGHGKFRKGPPKHSNYYGYRPSANSWDMQRHAGKQSGKDQSYTIEIQLPKPYGGHRWSNGRHNRNYDTGSAEDFYSDEDDYLQEYDEFEDKARDRVIHAGNNKRVRLKLGNGINSKLKIKISRDDTPKNIADSKNSLISGPGLRKESSLISLDHGVPWTNKNDWIPGNSMPSYPEALRGA